MPSDHKVLECGEIIDNDGINETSLSFSALQMGRIVVPLQHQYGVTIMGRFVLLHAQGIVLLKRIVGTWKSTTIGGIWFIRVSQIEAKRRRPMWIGHIRVATKSQTTSRPIFQDLLETPLHRPCYVDANLLNDVTWEEVSREIIC